MNIDEWAGNPPAWVAEKAKLDAMEDGNGPYIHWDMMNEDNAYAMKCFYDDFMDWANQHFGQGYSLACSNGDFLDQTVSWAFTAYCAGRKSKHRIVVE